MSGGKSAAGHHWLLLAWYRLWQRLRQPTLQRDSLFLMAGTVLAAIGGFFYWHFVAQRYSAATVGVAAAGITSATFLATLASLGLTIGLVRFLPSQAPLARASLLTFSLLLTTLTGGLSVVVFLAGQRWWAASFQQVPSPRAYQLSFAFLTLALTWGNLQTAFLMAERLTPLFTLRSLLLALLQLTCVLGLPTTGGPTAILWSMLLPNLGIALGLLWFNARRLHAPLFLLRCRGLPLGELLRYSLASLLFSLIWGLPAFCFPLLTLHRLGAASNAYLTIAWQLYGFLAIIPNSSASAFLIEGSHHEENLLAAWRSAMRNNLALLTPLVAAFLWLAPFVLHFFGAEYARQATALLRLLALSALPVSLNAITLTIYRIRKQIVRFNVLALALVSLALAAACLLIPLLGLPGIGWGWLAGQILFLPLNLSLLKQSSSPSGANT